MAGSLSDILAGLQNGVTAINGLTTRFSDLFGSSLSSSGSIASIDDVLSSMSGQLSAMSVTLSSISATQASMSTTLSSMSASVGSIAALSQLKLNYGQFMVYVSVDSSAAAGAANKIRFDAELLDVDNLFDSTTNYRYQPIRSGQYQFFITLTAQSCSGSYDMPQAYIYKDGVRYATGTYISPSSIGAVGVSVCSALVQLNGSSNYVEGYGYLPTPGTSTVWGASAGSFRSYMTGWRVA